MSEQEMLALVNPMKGLGFLLVFGWLIITSFIAGGSKFAAQQDTGPGSYLFGGVCMALAGVIAMPIALGVQFAIFFEGMTQRSAHQVSADGLLAWAGFNLVIGLLLLKMIYAFFESHSNDFVFGFLAGSSLPMIFVVIGLLGLGKLFGVISPDTFYALKIYMQEYTVNAGVLTCFIVTGIIVINWLAN